MVLIQRAAELKIRKTDRLECEERDHSWRSGDAIAWRPSGRADDGRAINCGFDLLEAKCSCCDRLSLVPLRALKQPAGTRSGTGGSALTKRAGKPIVAKERPRGENAVDLMEALRKSVGGAGSEAKAPKKSAKKPRKAAARQTEMLMPIAGKKPAKNSVAKKSAGRQQRNSA